jgi:hypothetical protein
LLLAPFGLAIGPSLPVDVLRNLLGVQPTGNEALWNGVSLDAYSVWPLVVGLVEGARGSARVFYPGTAEFILGATYQDASRVAVVMWVVLAIGLLALGRNVRSEGVYRWVGVVALGTMGFLLLMMPVAAIHLVIPLPFMILYAAFSSGRWIWVLIVLWTLASVVPMIGGFGAGIAAVPEFAPILHPSRNALVAFFMRLYVADWAVVVGTLLNIAVLLAWTAACLPRRILWRYKGLRRRSSPTQG